MNYIEAESIRQDIVVSIQCAGVTKQTKEQALHNVIKKYTSSQLLEAMQAIHKHYDKNKKDVSELFTLAIKISQLLRAKS